MKRLQYCFSSICLILLISGFCFGQKKIHSVGKRFQSNKAVDLVGLKISDRSFKTNEEFASDKKWIPDITFKLKNISDTALCYVEMELIIRPVGKMENPLALNLRYGTPLNLVEIINPTSMKNCSNKVEPGAVFEVFMADSTKDYLEKFIKERQVDEIEHADVSFGFVMFEDGRAWSMGHEVVQDAENPSIWRMSGIWYSDKSQKKSLRTVFISKINVCEGIN